MHHLLSKRSVNIQTALQLSFSSTKVQKIAIVFLGILVVFAIKSKSVGAGRHTTIHGKIGTKAFLSHFFDLCFILLSLLFCAAKKLINIEIAKIFVRQAHDLFGTEANHVQQFLSASAFHFFNQTALLDDDSVQEQLLERALLNLLFNGTLHDKPVDEHGFGLPDAVSTIPKRFV